MIFQYAGDYEDIAETVRLISDIHEIIMAVPVRSELFRSAVMLNEKLEHEHIDYAAEMKIE